MRVPMKARPYQWDGGIGLCSAVLVFTSVRRGNNSSPPRASGK